MGQLDTQVQEASFFLKIHTSMMRRKVVIEFTTQPPTIDAVTVLGTGNVRIEIN